MTNYFTSFFGRLLKPKVKIQTVTLEEHNRLKQTLEQANARINSLTKANEDIINKNDVTLAETELLEYQTRVDKITNILARINNISEQERNKLLQTLINSDLSIEFIEETYRPIVTKKSNIETKLPQKNGLERNDSNFIR